MKKTIKRNMNIDLLKGLAIISVILLHTYDGFLLLGTLSPLHIWQAVPVFMILQGLNNGKSYQRQEFDSLDDFFNPSYFYAKFKRLLFPYLIFFILQTMFLKYTNPEYFASVNHLTRFLTGGRGPGSYFVPLTIQVQLILPFIFLIAKKNVKKMLIGSFGLSILLEIFSLNIGISEELYRILIIRFIFALSLGIALSIWEDSYFKNKTFYFLTLSSVIYIIGVMYFNWNFIMEKYWHSQHAMGFFWPLFIVLFFKNLDLSSENICLKLFSLLGKASYHIFLVQLFYFWKPVSEEIPVLPTIVDSIVNVFVCSVLGIIFYRLERTFWEKIKK